MPPWLLVDRPPVKPPTLEALRATFEAAADDIWAVVPEYGGRHGHPMVLGREMIEVFLKASADANAREIQRQYQQHIEYAAVDDPFVAWNVNTPQDYEALLQDNSLQPK